MLPANPPGVRVVRAIKNRAAGLIEQLGKDLFDGGEVGIKIEMFLLDVEDERMLRGEEPDGAIAFIAFGHEIFAAGIPMRIRTEQRNLSTDVVGRVRAAFPQNMCRHGGRWRPRPPSARGGGR